MIEQPDFGNWIRVRRVIILLASGSALLLVGMLMPSPWRWLLLVSATAVLGTGLFLLYVYYQFDDRGGGVQRQLWRLTLNHLDGERRGRALDVGTGNGSLAIMLAMENASLRVVGVDLWNPDWDYSIDDCRRNAARGGVAEQVKFERGSADQLPFEDSTFDYVVSHFVFHEVATASDKRTVIREALRVLKPGGYFSFHDMFLDPALYGDRAELVEVVKSFGIEAVELVDLRTLLRAPRLLMGKRVLGNCAILHGRKR